MIHPVRADLLAALAQLSQLRPEWRLGQTLANLTMTAVRLDPGGVWELEDDEALAAARTLIREYAGIDPEAAEASALADGSRENDRSQSTSSTSDRRG